MGKTFIQLLGALIVVGFFKWAATHIQREREIRCHRWYRDGTGQREREGVGQRERGSRTEREGEIDTHIERETEQDRE